MIKLEPIITDDGTLTFRNPEFDDLYHSRSGALEEAFVKHAGPAEVDRRLIEAGREKRTLRILDVCFGLGYNSLAALAVRNRAAPGVGLEIIGLERDPAILAMIARVETGLPEYGIIQDLATNPDLSLNLDSLSMRLIIGDAAKTGSDPRGLFEVVFHDPFSPNKNPALWTSEFFTRLKGVMSPGGVLTTYSCARHVRQNLRTAGFRIEDGPRLGRRGPSTIALVTE